MTLLIKNLKLNLKKILWCVVTLTVGGFYLELRVHQKALVITDNLKAQCRRSSNKLLETALLLNSLGDLL